MTKVLVLYMTAGHGHRKVAEAIAEELKAADLKNFTVEVFDALDKTNFVFRFSYPRLYYWLILWMPWLWGVFFYLTNFSWLYALIKPIRSVWNTIQSVPLRTYLKKKEFDFIVSTHFFPAQVAGRLKKGGAIKSTLITVVTDVIPHRVWRNPGTDVYWVMAEESEEALIAQGSDRRQIKIGGIPISQQFLVPYDRSSLQRKFGLDPDRFTILFSSGSFGLGPTEAVLNSLSCLRRPIQTIVVCGYNQSLYQDLNKKRYRFPTILFGFVDHMPELMTVSDLLLAKPGGATTCESLAMGLPMVITDSIPGQEAGNAKWLLNRKIAFELDRVDQAADLLEGILQDAALLQQIKREVSLSAKPNAARDLIHYLRSEAVK